MMKSLLFTLLYVVVLSEHQAWVAQNGPELRGVRLNEDLSLVGSQAAPSYWIDDTLTSWRNYQLKVGHSKTKDETTQHKKCSITNGPYCGYIDNQLATGVKYP
jgi:hypothetical protein